MNALPSPFFYPHSRAFCWLNTSRRQRAGEPLLWSIGAPGSKGHRKCSGLPDAKLHGDKGRKVRGKESLLKAKFPGRNISPSSLFTCPPLYL